MTIEVGDTRILNGISFKIDNGERAGLYGYSGSGKSTLAWALLGELPGDARTTGQVKLHFGDQSIDLLDRVANRTVIGRKIAVIPQNPFTSLNPSIRCGKQIAEGIAGSVEEKEQAVAEMLSKLHFDEPGRISEAWPHTLSGGELQRVVIAMALINRPRLVVTDECMTALDPVTSREVLDILKKYCDDESAALLMISHDSEVLVEMCNTFYRMERGLLSASDLPTQEGSDGCCDSDETATDIIFAMKDAHKSFEGRSNGSVINALQNISFEIHRNEALGIAGQSGSGKSTIARLMTGLDMLDHGEMLYSGAKYDPSARSSRKAVQMIFQDPYSSLYPHKSAGYCIEEALEIHTGLKKTQRREAAIDLLQSVDLGREFYDRGTRSLSGGERQRVQIARALAVDPEILICDECTNGLDPGVEARIIGILNRLRLEKGMSLVFISHDLRAMRAVVDNILVIADGEIVESGRVEDILANPRHYATTELVKGIRKQ